MVKRTGTMGRGLSKLQREILKLAYEGKKHPGVLSGLPYHDIFQILYGWKLHKHTGKFARLKYHDEAHYQAVLKQSSSGAERAITEKWYTAGQGIPEWEYQKRWASVSRSIKRLVERGLVTKGWSRIYLTEKGREVASNLSEKTDNG